MKIADRLGLVFGNRQPRFSLLLVALPLVGLDQLVKELVVRTLEGGPGLKIIGNVIRFDVVRNSGAAFSLGAGRATLVFTILACAVSAAVIVFAARIPAGLIRVGAQLLLAGTLGNLCDRLLRAPGAGRGHVVDFIHIGSFPLFNISDMCITFAVACYLLSALRERSS